MFCESVYLGSAVVILGKLYMPVTNELAVVYSGVTVDYRLRYFTLLDDSGKIR